MIEGTLYNGKQFPDYIFNQEVLKYLFFEFDFVFTEEFWKIFKKFLERWGIEKLTIENLKPNYLFIDEINVAELPKSFIESARIEKLEGYFSVKASLYMITEQSAIYSTDNRELFCLFLDREFSLAILGVTDSKYINFFDEVDIKNITEYLKLTFAGKNLPKSFKKLLHANWKLL